MKIKDYANETPILTGDKVLGTAAADGSTKNFTVDELSVFLENNTTGYSGNFYDYSGSKRVYVVNGLITQVVNIA